MPEDKVHSKLPVELSDKWARAEDIILKQQVNSSKIKKQLAIVLGAQNSSQQMACNAPFPLKKGESLFSRPYFQSQKAFCGQWPCHGPNVLQCAQ
jgi:hypothetical protein